jgi:hypothetical protein
LNSNKIYLLELICLSKFPSSTSQRFGYGAHKSKSNHVERSN